MSVWSEVEPLPRRTWRWSRSARDWEMGKNFPAEIAVRADVNETLQALVPLLSKLGGDARMAAQGQGVARRARERATGPPSAPSLAHASRSRAKATPIDPDWLMLQIADALPKDAVVVDEGLTSARHLTDLFPYPRPLRLPRLASRRHRLGHAGGGRRALAQARAPGVLLLGDGSAMYSIQALWTAAHQKLPITYVIANNGGYRIIKQRLKVVPRQRPASSAWISTTPRSTSSGSPSRWACRPSTSRSPSAVACPAARLLHPRAQAAGCGGRRTL